MEQSYKRRRRLHRSPSPRYKLDDEENDDYEPYVPVAQRRQEKLAKLSSWAKTSNKRGPTSPFESRGDELRDDNSDEDNEKEKLRTDRTLLAEAQEVHLKKAAEGSCSPFPSTHAYSQC